MFVFFGTGLTAVIFKAVGTTPVHRELFILLKTIGHKEAKHDRNKIVGMGSSKEVSAFI